ncbi:protein FAM216A [Siphateles boraxobius]|uniref:protein FAM216A n=1 Tax=Siphateles boraxobius TaxID=180520 RepID=UPI00406381B6
MKKHVKFLENNTDKSRLHHKKSFLPLRPSGLNHVQTGKTNSVFGHKIQPATVQVAEQNRDIKTIHIPNTMTAAPFLQHPGLTPGQKRFLYSIAEAYSKEHMRKLICQHYMNVLHRCIRTVPDAHHENVNVKLQMSTYTPEVDHLANSQSTYINKRKKSGKTSSTSEKVKKTTLPKIVNHQRVSSGFAKSNMGQPRKRRATIAKHASSQGSRPWEADFEWKATETDSYLAGHMSGLSFNESEDDEEDFIFLT